MTGEAGAAPPVEAHGTTGQRCLQLRGRGSLARVQSMEACQVLRFPRLQAALILASTSCASALGADQQQALGRCCGH